METGRAALGQYAARGKQHLVLLRPLNGGLVMEQLHYADEVRSDDRSAGPARRGQADGARAREAAHRADSERRFEPSKYKDTVRERVMETIQRRSTARRSPPDVAADGGGKISTSWKR